MTTKFIVVTPEDFTKQDELDFANRLECLLNSRERKKSRSRDIARAKGLLIQNHLDEYNSLLKNEPIHEPKPITVSWIYP